MLRQLKDAPDDLRIDTFVTHGKGASTSELLRDTRADATKLIADPKRDIRTFRLARATKMRTKRGEGSGTFVTSVLDAVDEFYGGVVQDLRPWAAKPPRRRQPDPGDLKPANLPAEIPSTSLSSQDCADLANPAADAERAGPAPPSRA